MKPLIAIACCGLIGLALGCDGGGSDDSSANPVSGSTEAAEAVDCNKAYNPIGLLVHLPTAIDRRKQKVPPRYTGWVKEFRGDGAFALQKMVKGVDHGPEAQFYNQATPMAAFYRVNGKIHGLYRSWNRQGDLKSETHYEHGNKLAE